MDNPVYVTDIRPQFRNTGKIEIKQERINSMTDENQANEQRNDCFPNADYQYTCTKKLPSHVTNWFDTLRGVITGNQNLLKALWQRITVGMLFCLSSGLTK